MKRQINLLFEDGTLFIKKYKVGVCVKTAVNNTMMGAVQYGHDIGLLKTVKVKEVEQ